VQDKLNKAICIDDKRADEILSTEETPSLNKRTSKKKKVADEKKAWYKKPNEDKLVFYFSKPEFTDDLQYAVINIVYRCDELGCGQGATYIFKRTNDNWEIAGKMIAWGN